MKTIQEMLQELSQCIVTVSGEFRFRTNWSGGKVPQPDLDVFDPNVPFCIENVGDVPVEIGLYDVVYDPATPFVRHIRRDCKISYNLKTWQDYELGYTKNQTIPNVNKITLKNNGDRVYIKAQFFVPRYPSSSHTRFVVLNQSKDTKIRARGNIISLNKGNNDEYKTNYLKIKFRDDDCCFQRLFQDCTSLIQAPELPATELYQGCYAYMFSGCTGLTQAPELPAMFLGDTEDARSYGGCYEGMFKGCTGLTRTPELMAVAAGGSCYSHMFEGCTNLTQTSELPATKLGESCYSGMFQGCTSLTQAPELPATKLYRGCYTYMFSGCTSLTQAPELPATILDYYCYSNMFQGCTSLTQTPELPATKVYSECYAYMFDNCTALVEAPELPATELYDMYQGKASNYNAMFRNCTSLTRPPAKLPAMSLKSNCYDSMFQGCTSLTQAPELPATTLTDNCYKSMFDGCTKLNYVKCLATDTSATDCMTNWLYNVSAIGTFECDNKKYFTLDSPNGIPVGWTITEINPEVEKPDLDTFDPNVPFCIENVGDVPVEIGLYNYDKKNAAVVRTNCKISYDLKTWSDYTIVLTAKENSVDINKITLSNKGDRVYIKADKNKIDTTGLNASDIPSTRIKVINQSSETKIRARGNIASLNKGTSDAYKTNYLTMSTNDNLCYHSMFYDCTSLTQAPELPATKLLSWCYSHMFYGCTSLEVAPSLPSTTLANYCYESMFNRCTSLTQAPELPATTLTNSCYSYMFEQCKSLTQAPELPAATLIKYCYIGLFWGCSKLNYVKCLATSISAEHCTDSWLYEVSSTGDFYTPASTVWTRGGSGIPSGWTRHNITE